MVDNWLLSDVFRFLTLNDNLYSYSYYDLLMAIILWDDIYYPARGSLYDSLLEKLPKEIQKLCSPIRERTFVYSGDIVDEIAIKYLELSHRHNCDYLPCSKRQDFFKRNAIEQYQTLYRLKLQKYLDNDIEEYYRETFDFFSDSLNFTIKTPILVQYAIENTPDGMSAIEYALHLRNEGATINYRKYLEEIEKNLNLQKWVELRHLLKLSEDVVHDVIALDKKHIGKLDISVSITPSILFDFVSNNAKLSTPVLFSIKDKFLNSPKIHLTFLKDITKFAVNDLKFKL